jgi:aspartate/tyrosine/aromatic aminotransferase
VNRDAFSVRHFVAEGLECFVSQSFAKNFGLYGERAGSLSIVCKSDKIAQAVLSQLKLVIRPMYSNPPIHGALIVSLILNTPSLFKEWLEEVKMMSKRIQDMRQALFDVLKEKTGQEWQHILNQIGMFTYTGLAEAQVEQLITKYSIHMMKNGRISMAGINTKNVRYIAESIATVVKEHPVQKL